LSFTLTEPNDSFEIDLVDHVEYDLESPLVVFGLLAIFLESYDDLGLMLVIFEALMVKKRTYFGRLCSGEFDGSVEILPISSALFMGKVRDILQIESRSFEGHCDITSSLSDCLIVDLLKEWLGLSLSSAYPAFGIRTAYF